MAAPKIHDVIVEVTERIGGRSAAARGEYLERTRKRKLIEPARGKLACANLAHVMAASGVDKPQLQQSVIPEHRHRHVVQRHAVGASARTSRIPK